MIIDCNYAVYIWVPFMNVDGVASFITIDEQLQ